MAFCPNCGKEMSDNARFCPACGAASTPGPADPAATPQPPAQPPQTPVPPPVQSPTAVPPAPLPPGYGPGAVPPAPAPKKKGVGCKVAIIIVLAVILVAAVIVALLAIFVFKTVKAPVDVTNRYIEAVNNGDATEAWNLLSPDSPIRQSYTLSTFESDEVRPNIGALSTWNAHDVSISGNRARVTVDLTFTNGSTQEFVFDLRKENDNWLIYDYN